MVEDNGEMSLRDVSSGVQLAITVGHLCFCVLAVYSSITHRCTVLKVLTLKAET